MPQKPDSVIILGTGAYVPENRVTNDDMAQRVETSDEWIRTRTGIQARHFADDTQASSDLACEAARQALAAAGASADSIDLLIVATMTPDMPFPSTACLVQSKLGLGKICAFDLQAACSGFVYALSVAQSMLLSGNFKRALIIGAEKTSSILDFEDRTTCVLFGDGASAALLAPSDQQGVGILGAVTGSDGSNPSLLQQPAGGSRIPASTQSVAARQHYLKMNGKEIFKQAVRVMGQACMDILDQYECTLEQVNLVIPHQANMRIIESLSKRLAIPMSQFHNNLDEYGNTSAASVGIALDEAYRSNRIQSGDLILLVAFGAGLTWGASLIKWP
jgi:3-oxoacyl-[acyl-carrier-protein] synthase-3